MDTTWGATGVGKRRGQIEQHQRDSKKRNWEGESEEDAVGNCVDRPAPIELREGPEEKRADAHPLDVERDAKDG